MDLSRRQFVKATAVSMAMAAAACGSDGIMIEVHNDPANALSDGAQSLTPDQFDKVMVKIERVRKAALE